MSAAGENVGGFELLIITHNYTKNVNKESLFTSSVVHIQSRDKSSSPDLK